MASPPALNWKAVLVRHNTIASEHPRNLAKLKRQLRQAPHVFCSLGVEVAIEAEDGHPMGQALAELLAELRDPTLALRLYHAVPDRSVTLASVAVVATQQCLAAVARGTLGQDLDRGSLLNNLAVRLAAMGDYHPALRAAQAAVRFYRQRARSEPGTFRPYLAMSLNTLAVRLADCGELQKALRTAKEAVQLTDRLARGKPREYAADKALALRTLANRHSAVGNREEALRHTRQASRRYQLLTQADARYEPDFALSQFHLANRLTELGRHEEALVPAEQAVRLYSVLETRAKPQFEELTAAALHTLAVNLAACGQPQRAFQLAQQAVQSFEKLETRRPFRFLPDLVTALIEFADRQDDMEQPNEALRTARKALSLATRLHSRMGATATPYVTLALTNVVHRCLLLGRPAEGCKLAERCVRRCRTMVRDRPELRAELVNALIHWAEALRACGATAGAARRADEAVRLAKPMAADDLAAFGPRLAAALGTLANCEATRGNLAAALKQERQRVNLNRQLCKLSAVTHEPKLASGLANLATRLSDCGRREGALDSVHESLKVYDRIAARAPDAYREERAMALEIAAQLHSTKDTPKGAVRRRGE
jgi:tetratricopeptide (TPR) repeat protein